jgi:hypothetical protein
MMRAARENAAPAIFKIAKSRCAAGIFFIYAFTGGCAVDVAASCQRELKARPADSESRFLAIKKFSCLAASRLISARQNRLFARIAAADSQCDFWLVRRTVARDERSMQVDARTKSHCGDDAAVTSRGVSDAEFGFQQIVHRLRVGLAAG